MQIQPYQTVAGYAALLPVLKLPFGDGKAGGDHYEELRLFRALQRARGRANSSFAQANSLLTVLPPGPKAGQRGAAKAKVLLAWQPRPSH